MRVAAWALVTGLLGVKVVLVVPVVISSAATQLIPVL